LVHDVREGQENMSVTMSRAEFLKTAGYLIVGIPLWPLSSAAQPRSTEGPQLSGVGGAPDVDRWLAIDANGNVTVYVGKVELGNGIQTAFAQIVADELRVPIDKVRIIQGQTGVTPDQGVTSGSASLQSGAVPVRRAAAEARAALLELAAARLQTAAADLVCRDGRVFPRNDAAAQGVTYGALVAGRRFDRRISETVPLLSVSDYRYVGAPVPRRDIPDKVYGTFAYVHDVSISGAWHARVVRPPAVGAHFVSFDPASISGIPAARVVRIRDFVAVAAPGEWDAIRASRALKVRWEGGGLPPFADVHRITRTGDSVDHVDVERGDIDGAFRSAAAHLTATYEWPFQMHASIGPSCAVADVRPDRATIWSSTQGVYPLRNALADLLRLPAESVRVNYAEGAGCYGHNGSDDAAADAALISRAIGRPVRVQWMRQDEHQWEPKGPAMVMEIRGALSADHRVAGWQFDVWTPTHSSRPGGRAGNLLAAQLAGVPAPSHGFVGGDRNAPNNYDIPHQRVTVHRQSLSPLRVSALRGLGGPANTFANESFIDELAHAAGADPVAFRLAHLNDSRAKDVLRVVARLAGWQPAFLRRNIGPGTVRGRGVAFARYENVNACVAVIADVDVMPKTGAVRLAAAYVAHDCGLIVNPDGLRNQIEGNIIQASSRALKEEVRFDARAVTTVDWTSYPITRFPEIPEVHIMLLNRPNDPVLGAGEPATVPTPAAIANAIFAATGARVRTVPLTAERVRAAIEHQ
jgi:CO/xanthine dehydrogenase Mo-binding subunit